MCRMSFFPLGWFEATQMRESYRFLLRALYFGTKNPILFSFRLSGLCGFVPCSGKEGNNFYYITFFSSNMYLLGRQSPFNFSRPANEEVGTESPNRLLNGPANRLTFNFQTFRSQRRQINTQSVHSQESDYLLQKQNSRYSVLLPKK